MQLAVVVVIAATHMCNIIAMRAPLNTVIAIRRIVTPLLVPSILSSVLACN